MAQSAYKKTLENLSRKNILNRLEVYGFMECANVINFLKHVCDEELSDLLAFRYIHGKIAECIRHHTSDPKRYGNADIINYFQDLNQLKDELEFIISIK